MGYASQHILTWPRQLAHLYSAPLLSSMYASSSGESRLLLALLDSQHLSTLEMLARPVSQMALALTARMWTCAITADSSKSHPRDPSLGQGSPERAVLQAILVIDANPTHRGSDTGCSNSACATASAKPAAANTAGGMCLLH